MSHSAAYVEQKILYKEIYFFSAGGGSWLVVFGLTALWCSISVYIRVSPRVMGGTFVFSTIIEIIHNWYFNDIGGIQTYNDAAMSPGTTAVPLGTASVFLQIAVPDIAPPPTTSHLCRLQKPMSLAMWFQIPPLTWKIWVQWIKANNAVS